MAFARFRGITALLTAIMVLSVLSAALAAERSHAGSNPNAGEWDAYKPASQSRHITLPVMNIPDNRSVPDTPPPTDTYQISPGQYEASTMLTDARLSASVPKEFAARRRAELVQIAKSRTVMERSMVAPSLMAWGSDSYSRSTRAVFNTVTVTPITGTSTFQVSVRGEDAEQTGLAAEVIAQEIITRCQELDRSPKPLLSALAAAGTHPAKVTTPLRNRIGGWFFSQDNLLRTWIVLNCVGILLGIVAGRFMGRKHGSLRFYPVLAALTILALAGTGLWLNKERSKLLVDICRTTLICDPTSPSSTPAEIMELAKNKVVLDRAARVLARYDIRTTPNHLLAGLKTGQFMESDVIWIDTKVETEPVAKATADIIAGETIKRYKQLHGRDASVQAVQILDPAIVFPMPPSRAMNLTMFFGVPVAACLITLLIAYPISHRMGEKRRRGAGK